MNKKKTKEDKLQELKMMLYGWLDDDLLGASWVYHYVEQNNKAFKRGYRYAIYNTIRKIEDSEE